MINKLEVINNHARVWSNTCVRHRLFNHCMYQVSFSGRLDYSSSYSQLYNCTIKFIEL